ncbi:mechanosensitive ion channel, partial [Microcoleus sp. HI-ES]|nr:mechanosensitive ion channel [Microcoleus sp. HI-ES]
YFLGRWISDLVTNILTGIGFNNIFSWLGVQQPKQRLRLPPSSIDPEATFLQEPELPARTPSEFVGIVVQVGIMLFAVVAATDVLGIPALTAIVSGIVLVAGRVLAGLVVFAIGLYLANLAFSLIASSGTRQARLLGQAARIAIIAFVSALALQQMGIGSDIVNLAFGLLLGAIAVGIALAFGLGGREIAADQIRELLASFKQDKTPRL